jgi:hypothetical protein
MQSNRSKFKCFKSLTNPYHIGCNLTLGKDSISTFFLDTINSKDLIDVIKNKCPILQSYLRLFIHKLEMDYFMNAIEKVLQYDIHPVADFLIPISMYSDTYEFFRATIDSGFEIPETVLKEIVYFNYNVEKYRSLIEEIFGTDIGNIIIDLLRISKNDVYYEYRL